MRVNGLDLEICCGDLLQLQPVSGSPVFEKVSTKSLLYQLGCH